MRPPKRVTRIFESLLNQPGPLIRYLLPLGTLVIAICVQAAIAVFVPKQVDFPYVFFFLIAIFVTAWIGGYVPGILTCLIVMVGIPLLATPGFRLSSTDPSRLILLIGVSALVSLVANSQRKKRDQLREANSELDRRVQVRTQELAGAVAELESEIVQHKRTEQALRQSEERVDLALDAAGIGRWDVDLVTGKVDRSERHAQILGHAASLGGSVRETLFEHVIPEDRAAVEEQYQQAVSSGGVCEFEGRVKQQDGTLRWVWCRGRVLQDDAGRPVSFLGSSRDITDRKLAEQKLQTQLVRLNLLGQITRAIGERQDLRSIFQVVIRSLEDSLPIDFGCVCLYDPHAAEVVVNCVGVRSEPLAMDLAMTDQAHIGIDQNGLSQCVRGRLVYEQDVSQIDFPFPQRLARGGIRAFVAAPLLFESQVFGILIAARREPNSFSSGECEFLQQLSEHVALASHQSEVYNALQQAYDDLRQTQQTVMQHERLRALGQMASGIAHDINNAISPVALYTEMLLEQETDLSKRTREYLETTRRAIGDVAHTVARMREFYRQQEPQLVLSAVDLSVLVQQVVDLTRARWSDMPQQRGIVIDLRLDLGQNLPQVAGIESEIREALINLVFNAVDAMPEGGKLIIRTIAGETSSEARQVDVEVTDSGVGMNEETRRRCLEPFFTTKGERGTGLGLAMVYGVVRRHNADIEMESAIGQGTTVRLRFPVAAPNAAALQIGAPDAMPPRLRILSVDDDPLLIKSLRDALEADGHAVVTANGGQEGIDAFRAAEERDEHFAVVITDLGMPYVDGRKVASAIKNDSPSTPVILLTGWGQRLIAEGDVPPDVDRVLNKPPKLKELRAALAELAGTAVASDSRLAK
ncbi:MAG TPA: ATP-binding protein [Bryobacteraceae bacterium]|nr:ATP-binding protein [Bryobacteraceae bacterium]